MKAMMHRKMFSPSLSKAVACLLLLLPFVFSCSFSGKIDEQKTCKVSRPSMYTVVSITVVSKPGVEAAKPVDAVFAELDRLASLMNFYSEDSEISQINRQAGIAPVRVSKDTFEVIERSVYTSGMTDGAFDITVGPLVKLWDMQKKIVPEKKTIEETMKTVGYKNIILDKAASTVFLRKKGAQIDLGGILKGYAADRGIDILKQSGITSAIVAVGGEVRAIGKRQDGLPWVVGIQNPRQKGANDEIIATMELSDKATSTSGDYNKYFEKDGVRYHHLIDPKTGYPSKFCGSATIVADNAITSDGFSKLYILGPEKGLAVAKKLGFDAIFVDCNGVITMTDGLKDKIRFVRNQ